MCAQLVTNIADHINNNICVGSSKLRLVTFIDQIITLISFVSGHDVNAW